MSEDGKDTMPSESLDGKVALRIIMTGREAGSIIGKGGEIVRKIREESGANIQISDSSLPERVASVTGMKDAVVSACGLIMRQIANEGSQTWGSKHRTDSQSEEGGSSSEDPKKGTNTLILALPAASCGAIIGHKGSRVKELRRITGASIEVSSKMLPDSDDRPVTISGTESELLPCIRTFCLVMIEAPPRSDAIPYTPVVAHVNRGFARRGGYFQDNMMETPLGMPMAGPSCLPFALPPFRDRRGNGQHFEHTEEGTETLELSFPSHLIGCIIGKGGSKIVEIQQISGSKVVIAQADENSRSKKNDDGPVVERQVTITGQPESVILAHSIIKRLVAQEKLRLESRSSGHSRGDSFSGSYGGFDQQQDDPDRQTFQMSLSAKLVGCIIGKGGAKISEIQHVSGTKIVISNQDKSLVRGKASEREICITGDENSIAVAKSIISRLVEMEKRRLASGNPEDHIEPKARFGPTPGRGIPPPYLGMGVPTLGQFGWSDYQHGAPASIARSYGAAGSDRVLGYGYGRDRPQDSYRSRGSTRPSRDDDQQHGAKRSKLYPF